MSESKAPSRSDVATEAADWYARLRAENVSELDAARFRAWIAGDPARRREFEAVDAFWENLKGIENSPEVTRTRAAIADRRARSDTPRFRERRSFLWAAAAAILLVIGTSLWMQQRSKGIYGTDVGEQRTVPLADGSVVTLNTATKVRVHFSANRRDVELIAGQANFEVAKDPSRPFVVAAGDRAVRAVGTQFDVYKSDTQVTVTLIEGRVAVTPANVPEAPGPIPAASSSQEGSAEIILNAGEQLSYGPKIAAVARTTADLPRVEAWRARKLDFSDTPLNDAIAEANRYSTTQIVLEAPDLNTARISGTFVAGKNDSFVEGLQTYFHLDAERTGDRIVLTPRH
jgi:transmembrane sensor